MQTFLPYPNFALSAHVLDYRRLGKQRVECITILRTISPQNRAGTGWAHHRCTMMWRGYEAALCLYADCVIKEWKRRGYSNNLPSPRSSDGASTFGYPDSWATGKIVVPEWLSLTRLHASHRAALLSKDLAWYQQFCWDESPRQDYWWPGRLPSVGDYVIGPEQRVMMVSEMPSHRDVRVIPPDGGDTLSIARLDFFTDVWRRGVSDGRV